MPHGRVRARINAQDEVKEASLTRSLIDLLPSAAPQKLSVEADSPFYSYDAAESPYQPLPLSFFIKTTGRETEQLVEKEYEILDSNGESLKGRKARKILRFGTTNTETTPPVEEDEGFELL